MNRSLVAGSLLVVLPLVALLPGCGNGSGSIIPTPRPTATVTVAPTTTPVATATPTPTPNGNFNLTVTNSSDSNWGLTSFQTTNVMSYKGTLKGSYPFINLFPVETNPDGTTHKLDISLTKNNAPFAVGDSFDLNDSSNGVFSFTAEKSATDPLRPYQWNRNGSGKVSVVALSSTSITLQFVDVKVDAGAFGATGTITFNGTAQSNLPPS